jgi:hypothetical protein
MTSQFVSGPGIRDNYLKVKEPVYRYHYYGEKDLTGTGLNVLSKFNLDLKFGSSATLDMHKTWMIAIENFNATPYKATGTGGADKDAALSLVLGGLGQATEKSSVVNFDGTSVVFDFIAPYQQTVVITNRYIGHRITNPNFLNSSIPCNIYKTNANEIIEIADATNSYRLTSLQFTFVVYEYNP